MTATASPGGAAPAQNVPEARMSYGEAVCLALARATRHESSGGRREALKDHMYALNCSWQGLQMAVRGQRTVNENTGKSDVTVIKLEALNLLTDVLIFLANLDPDTPIMTPVQAINMRRQNGGHGV